MKTVVILLILSFFNTLYSQDFIFFNDSPTSVSYDASWGFVNSPSSLEKVGDKFPVEETIKYSGTNSLRLSWQSSSGGDWGIAVAEPGWPGHDATTKDSLSFWVYSKENISAVNLPNIYLEDLSNNKTDKQRISDFIGDIVPGSWTQINIPIKIFSNAPGTADLTKIKTIFFGQSNADNIQHTLYIDEIRMQTANNSDLIPPAKPTLVWAKGYNKHIDLKWEMNSEEDMAGYHIYKLSDNSSKIIGTAGKEDIFFTDFLGKSDSSVTYAISSFDYSGNESEPSNSVTASTRNMNDEELLTMLQESTFRFFWDYAHPTSGLTRERYGSGNTVTSGGSGMGLMAIIIGVERGFISRSEATQRVLKIVKFLSNADRFHGAWPHWLNGETGKVIPFSQYDNGGDLVETAYLVEGLLVVRKYFNENNDAENEIRNVVTTLWEEVEWDWYKKTDDSSVLYWHWSPQYEWRMNLQIRGFNEALVTYLLAIASPTHPVSAELYYAGWAGGNYINGKTFYNIKLDIGPDYGGPLFFIQYPFLAFDPRNKKDRYTNYFEYSKNVTLIHRLYAIDNPKNHNGYNENTWGLTASDDPLVGYTAHSPMYNDNGTITPTAALSSFPFTPAESMAAFKNFYNNYGSSLWGSYGFKDAFNPGLEWTAGSYISIDQGPIIVMIENYRTNLIWDLFMSNEEIEPMLDSVGFEIINDVEDDKLQLNFELHNNYPNPFNPDTIIEYTLPVNTFTRLAIYDVLGKEVAILIKDYVNAGKHKIVWNAKELSSGVYFYRLQTDNFVQSKKMLLIK